MLERLLRRLSAWTDGEADEDDPVEWLILGLGNPGPKYAETRHNVGRMAVERLTFKLEAPLDSLKHNARFGRARMAGQAVCLALPTTYMNESGKAAGPLARFYKVPPERVIALYDEMDLPLGQIRLRPSGGDGGHKGMRSLIQLLGTKDIPRIRMGIGRPREGWQASGHVLAKFRDEERELVEALIEDSCDAVERVVAEGIEAAMNAFNRRR